MFTKQIYIHPRKDALWREGLEEGSVAREKEDTKGKLVGLRKEVENTKLQKEAQAFQDRYPIDKFKEKVFSDIVKHPFISKTWIFFNDFKEIKKNVERFGANLPPAYSAVLKTAENIMGSKEFGKNTGNIEVFIRSKFGEGKTIMEFQENMRIFLDMARKQGRELTMVEFEKQFKEDRALSEAEKKNIDSYIAKIAAEIERIDGKSKKIERLEQFIEQSKRNPNNLSKAEIKVIVSLLTSAQLNAAKGSDSNSWFDSLVDIKKIIVGNGNTQENRDIVQKEADKLTKEKGGELHFI